MTNDIIAAWSYRFRKAAEADELRLLRDHLDKLDLPDEPELLLQGTLMVVPVVCVYRAMDSSDTESFLDAQTYHPRRSEVAHYELTFDLFGRAYARVLVDERLHGCDLADMFGAAWSDLGLCGYYGFYITRIDGEDITEQEAESLEEMVREDLFFDYCEDELEFWCDHGSASNRLFVYVTDAADPSDDDS